MEKIKELSDYNFNDTVQVYKEYEYESIPEATSRNMVILMDKINELTMRVNALSEVNKNLLSELIE